MDNTNDKTYTNKILAETFAKHILRWEKSAIDSETRKLLAQVAYNVSMRVSEGHVCIELSDESLFPEEDAQKMREMLLKTSMVTSDVSSPRAPLVIDYNNRIYLQRYYRAETKLAEKIKALCQDIPINTETKPYLNSLFSSSESEIDWQKIATVLALRKQFLVISGGPGTGKTTTVAKILACLLSLSPNMRIALAAPTGKAAARMQQSIMNQLQSFPAHIQEAMPKRAQTIHRLIGLSFNNEFVRFNENNQLPIDTLIIDEASMIDLPLAMKLFQALPKHARLILLGDKDQLASVETGSVFAALSQQTPVFTQSCVHDVQMLTDQALPVSKTDFALADAVIWLTQNYRFSEASAIGQIADCIRKNKIDEAIDFITENAKQDFIWKNIGISNYQALFDTYCIKPFADYFAYISTLVKKQVPLDPQKAFDLLNQFSLLCAVRKGRLGLENMNVILEKALCRETGQREETWYIGRPVIVTQNDYMTGLRNGDVGITLPHPENPNRLMVYFPDEDGQFKTFATTAISHCDSAYAITIHQSQGSEFDNVTVILPEIDNPIISRELVYTGITRAKKQVTLLAKKDILDTALHRQIMRTSGLSDQLEHASS